MEYLINNLKNSSIFGFDIMKQIYQYADPLVDIRKQIENKSYDLEEKMYYQGKKILLYDEKRFLEYVYDDYVYEIDILEYENGINDEDLKKHIINYYKFAYLMKSKLPTRILKLAINNCRIINDYIICNDIIITQTISKEKLIKLSFAEKYSLWIKL